MRVRVRIDEVTRARIVELARSGTRPALIAEQLPGVQLDVIYKVVCKAREEGIEISRFPAVRLPYSGRLPRNLSIDVGSLAQRDRLLKAAGLRKISETQLVRRLIRAVLEDDIIDAILDDGRHADAA